MFLMLKTSIGLHKSHLNETEVVQLWNYEVDNYVDGDYLKISKLEKYNVNIKNCKL
jgi:hypothetical protein